MPNSVLLPALSGIADPVEQVLLGTPQDRDLFVLRSTEDVAGRGLGTNARRKTLALRYHLRPLGCRTLSKYFLNPSSPA